MGVQIFLQLFADYHQNFPFFGEKPEIDAQSIPENIVKVSPSCIEEGITQNCSLLCQG